MKRFIIGVLVFCCTALNCSTVSADTANDLFTLYGRTELQGLRELQEKYECTLSEYERLAEEVLVNEMFNESLDTASAYQAEVFASIDSSVQSLLCDNNELSKEISENIDGDFEQLLQLDTQYKNNVTKINSLLKEKTAYQLTTRREIDWASLQSTEDLLATTKQEYDSSVEVSELGIVYGVGYPLGKPSYITSQYGDRIDPMNTSTIRFHSGIDLMADVGTDVLALFNGTVVSAGNSTAGGYYVTVEHGNGIRSYVCHLSKILCNVGDVVQQGDVIALSGNTGSRTTGPHLHLGIYIDGNSVNPEILFEEGLSESTRE